MENNIMALVGAFIGIAIMLGIGVQILGNSVQDCTTLPDYSIGEVSSVTVTVGGNYTSAPTVAFSGGGGSLAASTVTTGAISNGIEVTAVTVTEGGQDYTSAPAVAFDGGAPVTTEAVASATITTPTEQVGWSGQCVSNNTATQNAYTLLVIILIVVAAVAILSVVRML